MSLREAIEQLVSKGKLKPLGDGQYVAASPDILDELTRREDVVVFTWSHNSFNIREISLYDQNGRNYRIYVKAKP